MPHFFTLEWDLRFHWFQVGKAERENKERAWRPPSPLSTVLLSRNLIEKPAEPGLHEMEAGKREQSNKGDGDRVVRKPAPGCCRVLEEETVHMQHVRDQILPPDWLVIKSGCTASP